MEHNHFHFKFKRKKIKYPKENPIQDLIDLYKEEEKTSEEIDRPENFSDSAQLKKDDSLFLKELIQHNRKKHRRKIILLLSGLFIILAGAAAAGFLYFSPKNNFTKQDLLLEISAPEKIQVGQKIDYLISYQNLSGSNLLNSRVLVQYPHGFILEQTEPELTNHKWELGTLLSGQKGELKLSGRLVDELTQEQKLNITLNFEPSNFHSEFSSQAAYSTTLEAPMIDLVNTYPANITAGQKVTLTTKLKNRSDRAFGNIKLRYVYPEKFIFKSAKPTTFEDSDTWLITELKGLDESKEITVEGSFPDSLIFENDEQRNQILTMQMLLPGKDGQYFLVKEEPLPIKIIDQAINTYLIVNGGTENKTTELGKTLTVSAIVKNSGAAAYDNLTAKIVFAAAPIDILDWSKIKDDYFGKVTKTEVGKEITWTAKQLPALKSLAAGKDLTITVTLPIKNLTDLKDAAISDLGQATIEAHSEIILSKETNPDETIIKSSSVVLSLNSNIDLGAKALYYYSDGTPIGNGPWPPRAEETTILKFFWDLSNDIHEVSDIVVATTIPEYVSWLNEKTVSAGDLTFDESSRTISWKINRLPISVKEAHASFSLVFTPKKTDVGKLLKLTGNTTLTAKDTVTNELITKTKNILTTALEQDDFAPGNGTVQP